MKDSITIAIDRKGDYCDLVYSSDDGGYYAQRHKDDAVTKKVYDSLESLKQAIRNNSIKWEQIR